jgi:hypothetical protein
MCGGMDYALLPHRAIYPASKHPYVVTTAEYAVPILTRVIITNGPVDQVRPVDGADATLIAEVPHPFHPHDLAASSPTTLGSCSHFGTVPSPLQVWHHLLATPSQFGHGICSGECIISVPPVLRR